MPTIPVTFGILRLFGRLALIVNTIGAAALLGYGFYELGAQDRIWGFALVAVALVWAALGILLYSQFSLTHKLASTAFRVYDALLDMAENQRRQVDYARTMCENSSLSDWAKRIVYREKDYEYLRDTIQSAIVRQDWKDAERFIKDLDEQFDMREEAARLREEVEQARRATTEEKVAAALRRFEDLCSHQKWDQARGESRRLRSLFPADPRIADLSQELELRRRQHKRSLLKAYDEAVRSQNVDLAHDLLVELDRYLAPNEAAALKESARGVFKAKLLRMGVQFSLAVSDRQFRRAIDVGERIMREFPNSRYAQEIKTMLPALRQRSGQEPAQHEA